MIVSNFNILRECQIYRPKIHSVRMTQTVTIFARKTMKIARAIW